MPASQQIEQLAALEQQQIEFASPELKNLAEDMEDGELQEIARLVIDEFNSDEESRQEFMDELESWITLYLQKDEPINADGRTWGSVESVPILTESCNQFQARARQSFFGNKNFISAVPVGRFQSAEGYKQLEERARRIGNHMSYQLGFVDKDYVRRKDDLFLAVSRDGNMFTKTYYDPNRGRFNVENIRVDHFVAPNYVGPVSVDDLDRKTHIIPMSKRKIKELQRTGYFIDKELSARVYEGTAVDKMIREKEGLSVSNRRDNASEFQILEQHRYLDLGPDGRSIPVIVWVEKSTSTVLRLAIRYEVDDYGVPTDDYKPIEYFTHYKFMGNPDGFYAYGLGHLLAQLNRGANTILRQSIDAGTLANDGNMSGFISDKIMGPDGEELVLDMGKYKKVSDYAGNIQQGIYNFQFPGPNAALIQLGQYLISQGQRLGAVTEALTGTSDSVKQPTTLLTEVEQGLVMFTASQLRIAESMGDELDKIYRINQKYLPFVDYFVVNDVPEMITREDYGADMRIRPVFDPRFATQAQKIARATAIRDAVLQNPLSASRPEVIDAAFRRYLEAIEVDNVDELVPNPEEKPQVENIDDQYKENMFFLMPPEQRPLFDVFEDQNHELHLRVIDDFVQGPYGKEISPETAALLQNHRQKHIAFLYGQQTGQIPVGLPEMASFGGNQASIELPQLQVQEPPPMDIATLMGGMSGGNRTAAGS